MGYAIISHNQRKDNMTKETLDLIKDLFEMLKLQKEYSEILNKQIVNINAQIETLKKKG
jgi:uncharacterized protein YutD